MFRKPRTFRIQPTSGERGHVILIRVHKSVFQVRCTRIHRHMCTLGQATLDAFTSHLHYRQDVVWRHRVDLPLSTTATAAGAMTVHWYGLLSAVKYTILQRKLDILLIQCRGQMQHTNEELQCSLCSSCMHIAHLTDILAARESLMNARQIFHSMKQSLPLEMLFAAYAVHAATLQVCVCAYMGVNGGFSVISMHCIKHVSKSFVYCTQRWSHARTALRKWRRICNRR
ncbi:unnamed protein product [Sphagnum balticum]